MALERKMCEESEVEGTASGNFWGHGFSVSSSLLHQGHEGVLMFALMLYQYIRQDMMDGTQLVLQCSCLGQCLLLGASCLMHDSVMLIRFSNKQCPEPP